MTDDEKRSGRYGSSRHPSILDDDGRDDLSAVTSAILGKLKDDERRHLRLRLSSTSTPPGGKPGWQVAQSIAVAVVVAAMGAGATIYRNDAVNQSERAAMSRWVQSVDTDLREHARANMHAGAREAIARNATLIEALAERIKRIEAQLDAPTRRPR